MKAIIVAHLNWQKTVNFYKHLAASGLYTLISSVMSWFSCPSIYCLDPGPGAKHMNIHIITNCNSEKLPRSLNQNTFKKCRKATAILPYVLLRNQCCLQVSCPRVELVSSGDSQNHWGLGRFDLYPEQSSFKSKFGNYCVTIPWDKMVSSPSLSMFIYLQITWSETLAFRVFTLKLPWSTI